MPNQDAITGICNVCKRDVKQDQAKHHQGTCPVCQRETRHVTVVIGFPWVCSEPHANDQDACVACGKSFPEVRLDTDAILRDGPKKRICNWCTPMLPDEIRQS